jgi:hypothetical protein
VERKRGQLGGALSPVDKSANMEFGEGSPAKVCAVWAGASIQFADNNDTV